MNGRRVTASRRQIRKVIGASAVDVLERHAEAITELQHKTTEALTTADADLTRLDQITAVLTRPFLGRLKWLALGR